MIYYLLMPLQLLMNALGAVRSTLYRWGLFKSHHLPGKVISVGNIHMGGTGKTPVVMALVNLLKNQGARPAILTRGYHSGLQHQQALLLSGSEGCCLLGEFDVANIHADEARLQAVALVDTPVIVAADRVTAAAAYLKEHPQPSHWLLDDGFQHFAVARQLDIVLFDGVDPWPSGTISSFRRESLGALRRADLVFMTRIDQEAGDVSPHLKAFYGKLRHVFGGRIYEIPFVLDSVDSLAGDPLPENGDFGLVTAIARPDRMVEAWGHRCSKKWIKADHDTFSAVELRAFSEGLQGVITTEKDYWRQPDTFDSLGCSVYIPKISAKVPEELAALLG